VKFLQILSIILKSRNQYGTQKKDKTKLWGPDQKFYRAPSILSTALTITSYYGKNFRFYAENLRNLKFEKARFQEIFSMSGMPVAFHYSETTSKNVGPHTLVPKKIHLKLL
jgi:hypothetical protein